VSLSQPLLSNIQFTKCISLTDIVLQKLVKLNYFPKHDQSLIDVLKLINDIEVFMNPFLVFCSAAFVKFFRNFNFYMCST
jgi:hypothetical protein